MKRHKAAQFGLPLYQKQQTTEPFKLTQETTPDTARLEAEKAARERDRQNSLRHQKELFN